MADQTRAGRGHEPLDGTRQQDTEGQSATDVSSLLPTFRAGDAGVETCFSLGWHVVELFARPEYRKKVEGIDARLMTALGPADFRFPKAYALGRALYAVSTGSSTLQEGGWRTASRPLGSPPGGRGKVDCVDVPSMSSGGIMSP